MSGNFVAIFGLVWVPAARRRAEAQLRFFVNTTQNLRPLHARRMHYRHPGFLKTLGSRLGAGLADEILDRWFPQKPSLLERVAESVILSLPVITQFLLAEAANKAAEPRSPTVPEPPSGIAWAPGRGSLGEFTCPKCGGHTWSTLGPGHLPVVERYCTNGLETAYGPGMNPNTVKEPCQFRWMSSDDHLYFAKPSTEEAKRATETKARVPPFGTEFHPLMMAGTPPLLIPTDNILRFDTRDIVDGQIRDGICCYHARTTVEQVRRAKGTHAFEIVAISNGKQGRRAGDVLGVTTLYPETHGTKADLADLDRCADWGRPVLGVTGEAVEETYNALAKAIGDRFDSAEESLGHAAARILGEVFPDGPDRYPNHHSLLKLGSGPIRALISLCSLRCLAEAMGDRANDHGDIIFAASNLILEADAFIKKQSDKIADLMLDNVFPAGKGEVGFLLSEAAAKKLGLAYEAGAKPARVSLVLDGWQWAVRLGLGRIGGELIRVEWDVALDILRGAKNDAANARQEMMAQNAAGGVA